MKLISPSGSLDLPASFETEISFFNFLLSDTGTQSAPITLPATPGNLSKLGFSHRPDAFFKPLSDINVVVHLGAVTLSANLGINDFDFSDGISCTLYFGTGEFFSLSDRKKLPSLPWPVFRSSSFNSDSHDQRVNFLINLLRDEYLFPSSEAIFAVAPVLTNEDYTVRRRVLNPNGTVSFVDQTEKFILNAFERGFHFLDFTGTGTDELSVFEGQFPQSFIQNDTLVDVGLGYGMSPFLKLSYVVELVFSSFGYRFSYGDLVQKYPGIWDNVVLVNNVADAIYSGSLYCNQLVPNVLIADFIAFVQKMYAGKFVLNHLTKLVDFIRFADVFSAAPDMDLSPFAASPLKLLFPEFKNIVLRDSASPVVISEDLPEVSEFIDFDFLPAVPVIRDFYSFEFVGSKAAVLMQMLQIDSVIHKNSSLLLSDKTIEEKSESASDIFLADITGHWVYADFRTDPGVPVSLRYKRSHVLQHQSAIISNDVEMTNFQEFEYLYAAYANFRKNSNIPMSAKFNLKISDILSLNLSLPKLLFNQLLLIEKIHHEISPDQPPCEITFRTLRDYS